MRYLRLISAIVLMVLSMSAVRVLAGEPAPATSVATAAPVADVTCRDVLKVRNVALNRYVRVLDGQWQGNLVASDGNCYFFSSTHDLSHGAAFFRYDPRTQEVKLLAEDMTTVCGGDPKTQVPEQKVHSDICELDGWLYFGTHVATVEDDAAARYKGSHFVGYEMATGRFRDYGVLLPHYTIYSAVVLDPPRRLAYVLTLPANKKYGLVADPHIILFRVNLDSGEKAPCEPLRTRGNAYHMFVDADGNCWFIGGGAVRCLRAGAMRVTTYPIWGEPAMAERRARAWQWAQGLGDGRRCLATLGNDLDEFDSARQPVSVDSLKLVRTIGPTNLGMTCSGRRVFYIQRAERRRWGPGSGAPRDLHLMSVAVSLDGPPTITDHGLIEDGQGRRPWKIESLSADGKGHVYMSGAWYLLPAEEAELGVWKEEAGAMCGQFFAVADVSGDLGEAEK